MGEESAAVGTQEGALRKVPEMTLQLAPVVGRVMVPKRSASQPLEQQMLPYMAKGTLQMSLRVLRWGDNPVTQGGPQCRYKCSYEKEAQGGATSREERHGDWGEEVTGMQQRPETGETRHSLPAVSRGTSLPAP